MPRRFAIGSAQDLVQAERDIRARIGDSELDFAAMAAVSNIYRAANAIRNHMEQKVLAEEDLSWAAFTVLFVLWIWGEQQTRDLAAEAGVTKGTLTGVLKTLEKRGLARRRAHESDGRLVMVSLEPKGLGVIERLRVTPVSRVALLFGRALRDMFSIVLQSLILILIALPFGLSIHPLGVVVVLLLIGLIGLLTASIAYAVALAVKSEDTYAPIVFTAALPILLLSGVLLPMSIAPQWLQNIAHINPLLYAVDAARAVFNDHLTDVSVAQGVIILAVLSVVAVVIGARQFGRAIA